MSEHHVIMYERKFRCIVRNPCKKCKWFELYAKNPLNHLGWCKRFEEDPDAGYINPYRIPPCASWLFKEKEIEK